MKKLQVFGLVLMVFVIQSAFSQQSNATKLVELLYAKEIHKKVSYLKESNPKSITTDSLYIDLAKVYIDSYSNEEINALADLYATPLGEKLLKNKNTLEGSSRQIIYKWEAKQQGIDIIQEIIEHSIEADAIADVELSNTKSEKKPQKIKKELPKVNTLDDLRSLVKKDSKVLYDSYLLAELLGLKGILDPVISEDLPLKDNEKNKKAKN